MGVHKHSNHIRKSDYEEGLSPCRVS